MSILHRTTLFLLLALPFPVLAAARTFRELAISVAELVDTATLTLIVLGIVVYFWGMAINIPHFGDEKGAEKRKAFFFWGIVILFVMFSIWGIIQLIQNTLFSDSAFSPSAGEPAYTLCDRFGDCGFRQLEE